MRTIHCRVFTLAFAACLAGVFQTEAFAQRGGIYQDGVNQFNPRPTVSPYLNLLQGGGGAINLPQYQTLVRPFLDQQAVNQNNAFNSQLLSRQVNSLQTQVNRNQFSPGRATGHPTRYMNYSHYYSLGR
jgi:hypothetical protein